MTPANDNNTRPASFDAAVLQWTAFLYKMARKMEARAQDREELVQETIATALHRWASYREGSSMPAWLVFQMRERCHAIRKKAGQEVPATMLTSIPTSTPATQEDHVMVVQALASVRPRYRKIMALTAAGYDQFEIAALEGVSRQAVHERLATARKRLRAVA